MRDPITAPTSPLPSGPHPQGTRTTAPSRRRGRTRIVLGILGILASLVGLIALPLIGAGVGVTLAMDSAGEPTSLGAESGTVTTEGTTLLLVSVPLRDAFEVTCDAAGTDVKLRDHDTHEDAGTLGGDQYLTMLSVTAYGDQEVTLSCPGAQDVAYQAVPGTPVLVGAALGLGLPIVLGLFAIGLLVSGTLARRRTRP